MSVIRVKQLGNAGCDASASRRSQGGEVDDAVIFRLEGMTLSFGGVQALQDVSFDIRKGEVRAIIGPNGAGKTSMLNVINGFYHPQRGTAEFKGERRRQMGPYAAASGGIARTFQNVALFKRMNTLDNIITGRVLKSRQGLLAQCIFLGPARREEIAHREAVERIIEFLEIAHIRKVAVENLPYGLQKRVELGRALAMEPDLLLLPSIITKAQVPSHRGQIIASVVPRSDR